MGDFLPNDLIMVRAEMLSTAQAAELAGQPLLAQQIAGWVERIAGAVIGITILGVEGMRMPTVDRGTMTLLDTEKVLLSISGVDLGGVRLPADQFTWASSDETIVMLEAAEDPYTRWARTPTVGSAVITVTHVPSAGDEVLTLEVGFSAPGEIGLSAGVPVLEAPVVEPPPVEEPPVEEPPVEPQIP